MPPYYFKCYVFIKNFLNRFKLGSELESFESIAESINKGISFTGTNLWILVFAIFIASFGLNVNSNSVIIGAMLISPLSGPIIGLGFSLSINDLLLVKKSLTNYFFAVVVSLATSTLYFLITPISEAHSEILASTSPNIYDVLIAFFGGLAGVLAISSKTKGNVLAGMAVATALMPPLCTAGYGIANMKMDIFFGAFYLFIINTVFIAVATLITSRVLKFPQKKGELRTKHVISTIVIMTLLPSIYFAYDLVKQNEYTKNAEQFISIEAIFQNDFLLAKNIDAKNKLIQLTFGGEKIDSLSIKKLRSKLSDYNLYDAKLEINQGFTYNKIGPNTELLKQIEFNFNEKDRVIKNYKIKMDSVTHLNELNQQLWINRKSWGG